MDYVTIAVLSVIVVGFMEIGKNFLPANVNAKVKSTISLVLSVVIPVAYGIVFKTDPIKIAANAIGVIGLTQTSYSFVLKLFKAAIDKLKSKVSVTTDSTKATEK